MKAFARYGLCLLTLVLVLAACAPAALDTQPAQVIPTTPPPVAATVTATEPPLPSQTPTPTATPRSLTGITYTDASNGFALTYPTGWTLDPNKPIGSRADQALLFSPGTTAEKLAEGGARVAIVVYSWDPKNDLG